MRRGFWYGLILGGLATVGLAAWLAPRRRTVPAGDYFVRVGQRLRRKTSRAIRRSTFRAGTEALARGLGR